MTGSFASGRRSITSAAVHYGTQSGGRRVGVTAAHEAALSPGARRASGQTLDTEAMTDTRLHGVRGRALLAR